MGQYTITIIGSGAHHNQVYDDESERMVPSRGNVEVLIQSFLADLKMFGHVVEQATVTIGITEKLRGG